MILFLQLFLAHILGDFILQSNAWVKSKQKKKIWSTHLYLHILLHGVQINALFQGEKVSHIGHIHPFDLLPDLS